VKNALSKIRDRLKQLSEDAQHAPVDPFELGVLARQIEAQIEMLEEGLVE